MNEQIDSTSECFYNFISFFLDGDEFIISDDKFLEFQKSFIPLHIKCIKLYCDSFNNSSDEVRHKIYFKMNSSGGLRCLKLVKIDSEKSPYSKFCKTGHCSFDIVPEICDLSKLI